MGWTFLPIQELPDPGDIVWCKFPHRERPGYPGPDVRPVLVREAAIHRSGEQEFGAVMVSYGTGVIDDSHYGRDLIIEDWRRVKALGLHKPTRFALDEPHKKNLIWAEEFFVSPRYVAKAGILIGRLDEREMAEARECLRRRGLL